MPVQPAKDWSGPGLARSGCINHSKHVPDYKVSQPPGLNTWRRLMKAAGDSRYYKVMFLFHRPAPSELQSFVDARRESRFSYPEVGATRNDPPAGYNVDHNRVRLGVGEEAFARAVSAVRSWKMFDIGWCRVYPADAPIAVGTNVCLVADHFGFWSVSASRIVYLLDEEQGNVRRYGFAYGTLLEHVEVGEERFSVELNREDGSVWYDLYAFSRPRHILVKLGYPLGRMLQRRFARDSKRAMVRAVAGRSAVN